MSMHGRARSLWAKHCPGSSAAMISSTVVPATSRAMTFQRNFPSKFRWGTILISALGKVKPNQFSIASMRFPVKACRISVVVVKKPVQQCSVSATR